MEEVLNKIQEKLDKGEELTQEEEKEIMSMPPDEGNKVIVEEDDPFSDMEEIPLDGEKKEEAPKKEPEKDKEAAEAKEGEKTPEVKEEKEGKKETEAKEAKASEEKKDEKEDEAKYSEKEKGLYSELRQERRKRQLAEEERDLIRFQNIKKKATEETTAKDVEEEEFDFLKDRDPDEPLTVKDVQKINQIRTDKNKKAEEDKKVTQQTESWRQGYLRQCQEVAMLKHDDFIEVSEAGVDIIQDNPDYQKRLGEALAKGENPALIMYDLVKNDPQFNDVLPNAVKRLKDKGYKRKDEVEPVKKEETPKEDKTKKAKEADAKIKENDKKPKTSGHHSGGEGKEGYYTEEVVSKMSDAEFAALPKNTREALLKKYG